MTHKEPKFNGREAIRLHWRVLTTMLGMLPIPIDFLAIAERIAGSQKGQSQELVKLRKMITEQPITPRLAEALIEFIDGTENVAFLAYTHRRFKPGEPEANPEMARSSAYAGLWAVRHQMATMDVIEEELKKLNE